MKILLDAMNETLRRSLEETEGNDCDAKKDCTGGGSMEDLIVVVAIIGGICLAMACLSCICYRGPLPAPLANCMRYARERVGFNYGAAEYHQANRLPDSEHGNNYSAVTEDMRTPKNRSIALNPSDTEQDNIQLNVIQQKV